MVLYRVMRSVNAAFPFMVFWMYLGAFLGAFAFIFVFPPVALLLVFACVLSVPVVFLVKLSLKLPEFLLARHALKRGKCPRCGEFVVNAPEGTESAWHCVSCGSQFTRECDEVERLPTPHGESDAGHTARLAIDLPSAD